MKALLIATLLSLATLSSAMACSCEQWESAPWIYKQSEVLFLGVPDRSQKIGTNRAEQPIMSTKFSVVRGYKNTSAQEIEVLTIGGEGASCEMEWEKNGGIWLIAAWTEDGKLHTDACSNMTPAAWEEDPYDTLFGKMVADLNKLTN